MYALPSLYVKSSLARISLTEHDIASLLFVYRSDTAALFTVLQQYLSASDIQAVERIIVEIEDRITRFQKIQSLS